MKVSVSKSKNQTIYYLSKSVWIDGKSTTKTIEKIGSEDELLKDIRKTSERSQAFYTSESLYL